MCKIAVVALLATEATAFQLSGVTHSQMCAAERHVCMSASRRTAIGAGAAAALGLVIQPAFADEEYISPAKAKILAAKAAAGARSSNFADSSPTPAPAKKQAVVSDSSAQGREGNAQKAQKAQKKLAKQLEREKEAEAEARKRAREIAKANEKPPQLPSLPSLPSLPF